MLNILFCLILQNLIHTTNILHNNDNDQKNFLIKNDDYNQFKLINFKAENKQHVTIHYENAEYNIDNFTYFANEFIFIKQKMQTNYTNLQLFFSENRKKSLFFQKIRQYLTYFQNNTFFKNIDYRFIEIEFTKINNTTNTKFLFDFNLKIRLPIFMFTPTKECITKMCGFLYNLHNTHNSRKNN